MPSRRTGIFLFVALLGPLLVLVSPRPALADETTDLTRAADAAPDDTLRVLVRLDTTAVPETSLSPAAVTRQRDRIDAVTADLLTEGDDLDAVQTYETLPYIAVNATAEEIRDLAASDDVLSVTKAQEMHTELATSAPKVWGGATPPSGYDGTGWNAAVVDTGVQSAHSFFTASGTTK